MNNEKKVNTSQFSQAVTDQLQKGNIIEAIKIIREETGMSLSEAKDLIDNAKIGQDGSPSLNSSPTGRSQVVISSGVLHQLTLGKKIEAIKILRGETKMGLKDAKDAVEQALIDHPEVYQQYQANNKRGIAGFLYTALIVLFLLYVVYRFLMN